MSFGGRGPSRGSCKGRKKNQNIWRGHRRKKFRLLVRFDANLEEFAQLAQTCHLYLGDQPNDQLPLSPFSSYL
jgi:hypothetical protein